MMTAMMTLWIYPKSGFLGRTPDSGMEHSEKKFSLGQIAKSDTGNAAMHVLSGTAFLM
jgi:hypothetical protein